MIQKLIELTQKYFRKGGETGPSHTDTGAFENSLRTVILKDGKTLKIQVWGLEYGTYLNRGVQPENVPFTPTVRGKPRGGTSEYIKGLYGWVQRKLGVPENEALGVAFAIARTAKERGFPERPFKSGTLGSGWIDHLKEEELENLKKEASSYFLKEVDWFEGLPFNIKK